MGDKKLAIRPFVLGALGLLVAVLLAGAFAHSSLLAVPARILLGGVAVALALYLFWKGMRRLLFRVGRRLAFSYFLIGVLPIPMLALMLGIIGYLLSGYFLGTLYRTAVLDLRSDLHRAAVGELGRFTGHALPHDGDEVFAFAYYRDGRRVAGDERAPSAWSDWMTELSQETEESIPSFLALPDESPTLGAAAISGRSAVLAFMAESVERHLSQQSGVWVTLMRPDDPGAGSMVTIQLRGEEFALRTLGTEHDLGGRREFFGLASPDGEGGAERYVASPSALPFFRRPFLWWGEVTGAFRQLADGAEVSPRLIASLNGTLLTVKQNLFSRSAELNASVWASLIGLTGLLATLYGGAVLMALFMIFGLSSAVNRLSVATEAVREGDFSTRIPVHRRDQLGVVQRSFNEMTAHLESLVVTAAQKELLEKELALARDLQESLLPRNLPATESVEFATLFEPSAAIGGDYFDILRIDDSRLAVVIADVSGHGLPTGLRMAMLKAALVILVEEAKPPGEILRRLDSIVRAEKRRRFFVTATIAVVDFRSGRLEITNAGHPPTYVVRCGEVEEVELPGSPLGALDDNYGRHEMQLEAGDVVVWLSDGLIEAANGRGEPFGYQALRRAMASGGGSAAGVREAVTSAVESHVDGQPAEDDRTLVAMTYRPPSGVSAPRNE